MTNMISYCGINCAECPGYIATQKNDNEARKIVAAEWRKIYNLNVTSEDINCDGCQSQSSRHFSYCSECKVRKCGTEKNVENCAYCEEYICEQLNYIFEMVPNAKIILDSIRNKK